MSSNDSHSQDASVAAIDGQVLTRFLNDIGGDSDALAELLLSFLDDAERLFAQLGRGVAAVDAKAVAATAHTFKSTSASVGAHPLANLCAELDRRARSDGLDSAVGLVVHIGAELSRVRALLLPPPATSPNVAELLRRIA